MSAPAMILPELRADLALIPGGAAEDGSPTWLIHDVSRNRYFRLGLDAFQALGQWKAGLRAEEFLSVCASQHINLDEVDLRHLLQFLVFNQLIQVGEVNGIKRLLADHARSRQHWLTWLLHHYLFFKIPLIRPDAFLERTWPWVSRLVNRWTLGGIRLLGLLGILMVIQQWESFVATFLHFWSLEGLVLYTLTLALVMSAHELGHAYVAKRHGCRVGAIGVAMLVMFPVLYTDTTDSWRLRSSRDRLQIVLAGVSTELHLAMLATFAWCFLPDGPLRSAAFFVATTSWVSSLLVNISPFLRFDGYFALSDLMRAENLQPRSFALARWNLREMLFGFGEPVPEILPTWRRRVFIAYAYVTWAYRAVIFVGIALLIYHFSFKVLGIILFVVEIAWFILMPLRNEVMQWWMRRKKIRLNLHTSLTTLALAGLLLAAMTPWHASLSLPAVLLAGDFRVVHSPEAGRVVSVHASHRDQVEPGRVLVRIEQPEIEHGIAQTRREMSLVEEKIQRQVGSLRDRQDALVLTQQRDELRARLAALVDRQTRLQIAAPIGGMISQIEPLQRGQWVAQHAPLATVRSEHGLRLMALVSAADLHRLESGAQATWMSDLGSDKPRAVRLARIDYTAIQTLPWPELSSEYGGPVPSRKVQQVLRPEGAWYQVELEAVDDIPAPRLQQTGRVRIDARAESLISRYWRHAAAVWIRESGF